MSDGASRRKMLQLFASGGTVGVAGCIGGDGTDEPAEDDETERKTETAEPADDIDDDEAEPLDSITVALGDDPTRETWGVYGGVMPYYTNILEPLIWVTDDMELEPWLATDWEQVDDVTWVFDIREGVQFHNGAELTAEDVVFSFREVLDEWAWAPGWLKLEPESVQALDDHTVEFTTTEPFPPFAGTIAHNMVAIQHPDRDRDANEVVGTGPLRVEEIEQEQQVVTSGFDDYWGDDAALEEVVFRVIEDPNTRSLSLSNHEVDVAFSPPRTRVEALSEGEETEIYKRPGTGAGYAGINIHRSPTDDRSLRRALNHAISQELIVSTILEDVGVPAEGPISPEIYWSAHGDVPTYEQDEERASELVEESSYDGEELTILVANDMVDGREMAQVFERSFDGIGVESEIQVLERAAFSDAERNGEGHLILKERGPNSGAADYSIYESYHSDGDVNQRLYREEGTGLHNPGEEVDELLEEGYQTNDSSVKEEVYGKVQQIVMDEAVVLPMYYSEYLVGTYEDVTGLDLRPIPQFTRWVDMEHWEL